MVGVVRVVGVVGVVAGGVAVVGGEDEDVMRTANPKQYYCVKGIQAHSLQSPCTSGRLSVAFPGRPSLLCGTGQCSRHAPRTPEERVFG